MDTQPLIPNSPSQFSIPPRSGGRGPLLIMMLAVLALGTIGFGIATVVFSNKASKTAKTLEVKVNEAAAKARADQKKLDDEANAKINGSPFRAYTAPPQFGSFVINFPKHWSSYLSEETSGAQVQLLLNPDFVRKINGKDAPMATKVALVNRTKDQYLSQFTEPMKKKTLQQTTTKVSEQTAYDITGTFSDRKTIRQVVVPIRDKVLVFSIENSAHVKEFDEILAQAKIIP